MKSRKTKDLQKTLLKKGFYINPKQKHHESYYLYIDGKKSHIHTFFSHSISDYNPTLMGKIKNQLKFIDSKTADLFFDCPFSYENYVKMLQDQGEVSK